MELIDKGSVEEGYYDHSEGDFVLTRKEIRKRAWQTLKKHYWIFVAACLLAAVLGTDYANTLQLFQLQRRTQEMQNPSTTVLNRRSGEQSLLNDIINGDLDKAIDSLQHRIDVYQGKDTKIGDLELGHSEGVLASVVNTISSGSLLMSFLTMIDTMIGAPTMQARLFAFFGFAALTLVWVFLTNVYRTAYARVFLEGRIYEKVPFSRFVYLFRLKKHVKASFSMAVYMLIQYLGLFTIVLYPVVRFAYQQVPYLVAENPDLSPLEALRLSRRMMKGHKWEAFLLEMSLLPWVALSIVSGGLVGMIFYNPYRESVLAEYYVCIRGLSMENQVIGCERLTDRYLFEHPSKSVLNAAYADAVRVASIPRMKYTPRTGFWGFVEKYLGIVPSYDAKEKEHRTMMMIEMQKEEYRDTLAGKIYPTRLYPIPAEEKRKKTEDGGYMRHYPLTSVILMFFIICIFGWLWEVALHLVQTGDFVNRGTLHGPWLPIYGAGCVAILAILYKLRRRPLLEFVMIIVLCGVIEYATSWILEVMHDGQRWWDYSGYYLNLNGRICAEGLLVFGIGGAAFVYVLAPWIDNQLVQIRPKILWPVCITLLAVFVADVVYSAFVPNTGKGVTSAPGQEESQLPGEPETDAGGMEG